jgi:hypothetical protein
MVFVEEIVVADGGDHGGVIGAIFWRCEDNFDFIFAA